MYHTNHGERTPDDLTSTTCKWDTTYTNDVSLYICEGEKPAPVPLKKKLILRAVKKLVGLRMPQGHNYRSMIHFAFPDRSCPKPSTNNNAKLEAQLYLFDSNDPINGVAMKGDKYVGGCAHSLRWNADNAYFMHKTATCGNGNALSTTPASMASACVFGEL